MPLTKNTYLNVILERDEESDEESMPYCYPFKKKMKGVIYTKT